jgi:DNA-binding NtrC family response regulator
MNSSETGERPRVLVIEPEPEARWDLVFSVQRRNCQVRGVSSGEAGVAFLVRTRPRFAFCSLALPDTTGVRVLRRAAILSPATHVVLMAKWRTRALLDRVTRAGGRDLIRQPAREREVTEIVDDLWAQSQLQERR